MHFLFILMELLVSNGKFFETRVKYRKKKFLEKYGLRKFFSDSKFAHKVLDKFFFLSTLQKFKKSYSKSSVSSLEVPHVELF